MDTTTVAPLSLETLLLNLGLCIVLSSLLAVYYRKFGSSLSNRAKFSPILPLLSLITLLVISIVKSSLALSLGLVGALSIVRFRTAIKDPEELIFLFFAIGIGLGFGADQRIATLVAFGTIMVFLLVRYLIVKDKANGSSNLFLNLEGSFKQNGGKEFTEINQTILGITKNADLRRLDSAEDHIQVTYYVHLENGEILAQLMDTLRIKYPKLSVSIIEQDNLLGG
ncbi:MAG: DUF4956 domain-containing protein [Chloroflexi bacterium]|nr:DUF4956 domain-containing protein [Chloroflexota bacterium]